MSKTEDNTKNTLKVGIIGCGEIAKMHIPAIQKSKDAVIVGLCDLNEDLLNATAERFKLENKYRDPAELLDKEKPNIIHILTPPQTHYALTKSALEAGAHVFVEKPLAMNAQESEELFGIAEQKGLILCTGHSHLFDHSMQKAQELVKKGVIGDVCGIESYYGFDMDPKYFSAKGAKHWAHRLPGGIIMNRIDHPLSVVLPFMGKIKSVKAAAVDVKSAIPLNIPGELRFILSDDKALAQVTLSLAAAPRFHELKLFGTKGSLSIDLLNKRIIPYIHIPGVPRAISRLIMNIKESFMIFWSTIWNVIQVIRKRFLAVEGIPNLIESFYDAVRNGKPCPIPSEQIMTTMHVMDEIWNQIGCESKDGPVDPESLPKASNRGTSKILVTGATGFVGHNLIKALHEKSDQDIRVLARNPIKVSTVLKNYPVEVVYGDVSEKETVLDAMDNVDTVYHLAATMGGTWEDYEKGTIQGTQNIVDAAIEKKVRKFVFCSSIAVYGIPENKKDRIGESTPHAKENVTDYMRSKIEAEKVVQDGVKRGLNATILRPGVIYGGPSTQRISRIGYKLGKLFVIVGCNDNELPLTHIDNVVQALMLSGSSDNGAGKAYNVVDDENVTQTKYLKSLNKHQHAGIRYVFFPYTVASGLGSFARKFSGSNSKVKKIANMLSPFHLTTCSHKLDYDNTQIKVDLMWKPEGGLDEHLKKMPANV